MFKPLLAVIFAAFFAGSAFAAGPAQIWRLEITASQEGIVEVPEIDLLDSSDASVLDLIRSYTHEETAAVGAATWSISHNMGIQSKFSDVSIIAYDVDVVAPGEYYLNTNTMVLSYRSHLAWEEVEYFSGDPAPATPEIGDVWYSVVGDAFTQWDGGAWVAMTVSTTTAALPQPNAIEATSVTMVTGAGLPATGGAAANNDVEIVFPEPVVGAATIIGSSFDTVANDRPGDAIPPSELIPNRAAVVAFDGNAASWFKSRRAPTQRSPLALQYTFWVGDPSRYPNVAEYTITARKTETAPRSWQLMYWMDGGWKLADQQAGIKFEDGETKSFPID